MDYRFQVNLGGIINLLANNLYSGPRVFLRELLQNSVDAIHARDVSDPAFKGKGRISIEVIEAPAPATAPSSTAAASPASTSASSAKTPAATIICEDNGIGLTEDEVHKFLATIGESSKRNDLGHARADFIGQFGIGLLSCFMVADEIVVITRSARDKNAKAVEWRGRPDGTYSVKTIDSTGQPGTRVYLRASPAGREFFDVKTVRELATKYGSLLPHPITVTAGKRSETINAPAPWEAKFPSAAARREALLAYGKDVFDVDFLDCIPLESAAGDAQGVAFVLPFSPSPSAKGRHRIYLKRMLLSEAGEGILPEWAFFVRCVINANGLRPTAAREGFYEDDALAAARSSLGDCLRTYLLDLSRTDVARLKRVIQIHYLAIKALAVYDDDFYRIFVDWIPFETSLGTMNMRELRTPPPQQQQQQQGGKGSSPAKPGPRVIKYVPSVDEFRQIARVAAAQDVLIVNAGYTYNEDLLLRLPEVFDGVRVEPVSAADLAQSFEELTLDEREKCFDLLKVAQVALQPFRCAADVRKFEPAELAALFTTDPDAALSRAADRARDAGASPITSALDSILGGHAREPQAYLLMNHHSPLIGQLAQLRDPALLRRCVEMLYVQALLLGHHPLSSRELNLLNSGLSSLIQTVLTRKPD